MLKEYKARLEQELNEITKSLSRVNAVEAKTGKAGFLVIRDFMGDEPAVVVAGDQLCVSGGDTFRVTSIVIDGAGTLTQAMGVRVVVDQDATDARLDEEDEPDYFIPSFKDIDGSVVEINLSRVISHYNYGELGV